MKLHGWTDAFQRYFLSFYRKNKIKLGDHTIHTKSIYFVDLNQEFSRKMSLMLRCDSNIFSAFIGRMILNLLTAEPTQKQFTFYQVCVEKDNDGKITRGKKATIQIMTFQVKCQTLMRCDSLCDENDFPVSLQGKSFILEFKPLPLYWDWNGICSSIGRVHMIFLLRTYNHLRHSNEHTPLEPTLDLKPL